MTGNTMQHVKQYSAADTESLPSGSSGADGRCAGQPEDSCPYNLTVKPQNFKSRSSACGPAGQQRTCHPDVERSQRLNRWQK